MESAHELAGRKRNPHGRQKSTESTNPAASKHWSKRQNAEVKLGKIEIMKPLARIEVLLQTWADWMRHGGSVARGYPSKACGFAELGVTSIEDIEDTSDDWLARALDAIIRGLPDQERAAIDHQYLDARYRYLIVFYAPTLYNAKKLIQAGIERKGIW